jgi:cytochrome c-type biogenesis protein CcmF
VRGEKITVGAPLFLTVNIPLGLFLLFLTGVGPLIAWRRASVSNLKRQFAVPASAGVVAGLFVLALGMRDGYAVITYTLAGFVAGTIFQEFAKGTGARRKMYGEGAATALYRLIARNRRRYGGYIVHGGIVILFAAFAGMAFKTDHELNLDPGESATLVDPYGREWSFTNQGVSRFDQLNRQVEAITLELAMDGRPKGVLSSEKRQHVDRLGRPTFDPSTDVGILTESRQDVYLVFTGMVGEGAEVRISFNPLVVWVWIGGALLALGGLVVMWPQADRARAEGGYITVLKPGAEYAGAAK